jgi:hypothetical protein
VGCVAQKQSGMTPQEKLDRWFVRPVEHLKSLPNGDGGYIALAVALLLFERYFEIMKQQNDPNATKREKLFAASFPTVSQSAANEFWDMARNGMFHAAALKQESGFLKYDMGPTAKIIEIVNKKLLLDPWGIADGVIALWQSKVHLFDSYAKRPLPIVYEQAGSNVTASAAPVVSGVGFPPPKK